MLTGSEPPPTAFELAGLPYGLIGVALGALAASAFLAVLYRSLVHSVAERVLADASEARRDVLRPLLARVDDLATSAGVLESTASLAFVVTVLRLAAGGDPILARTVIGVIAVCVPLLWFVTRVLATAIALRSGDVLLRWALPSFHALQLPLSALAWAFSKAQRGVLRLFGLRDDATATREIVADLREVIEDADISGNLDESEKEMIGNVMDFRDVDVAAVMTPRTEIEAADVADGVLAAARCVAESGHSRVPVYEDTPDRILGTVSARDLVEVASNGGLEEADLRALIAPPYFVPETKHVAELLQELRHEKIKMAIVLDEYGGTAGIVTVGDILAEIVGDLPDENAEDEPDPVRHLPGGVAEVEASLHVSEVNEALDLEIPEEEDYETLGGFVLAELGHFPREGESFVRDGIEYEVSDSNDRRVLRVRVRRERTEARSA